MDEFKAWLELANGIGSPAVLGVVCWKLWGALTKEQEYSKTRDKETLTVLNSLVNAMHNEEDRKLHRDDKVMMAIQHCEETIIGHINKTSLSGVAPRSPQ